MLIYDQWQQEVLAEKSKNLCVCSGRQTGKSTIVAHLAGEFAMNNSGKNILIVSVTEDQAIELLTKVLMYVHEKNKFLIAVGKNRPTKSVLRLKNKSVVRTKAVGATGQGVRGFTIDMLIADEAAFMPEDVWPAVTPMLLTTGGRIILLSTPHGKQGYFYQCYHDENFRTFHVNSVEVMETREICETWTLFQKDKAIEFLASEKERMSQREYGQEYLGQFIDDFAQFFQDEAIKRSLIQEQADVFNKDAKDFVLGVDIGRMGGDQTAFVILERKDSGLLVQREQIVWKETTLDKISDYIIMLDKVWSFRRIFLDSGGIGIGVFDILYNTDGFKRKVKGINNSTKVIEYMQNGKEKKQKLMKEEIYTNLLMLMFKGKIVLLDNSNLYLSLKGVQYEYLNQRGGAMMKIFSPDHRTSHIVEALVRAAYFSKEKNLNPFVSSFPI